MRIKTRFYYHEKGKYFLYGGWMTLKGRNITRLGNLPVEHEGKPFYYDDTYYTITYEHKDRKGIVDANRIITESAYNTHQREYLVKLSWFQQQKLLWMFHRQWLQQRGNMVHIIIAGIIVTLAFMGFELFQQKF